jgi:hypothetical protein
MPEYDFEFEPDSHQKTIKLNFFLILWIMNRSNTNAVRKRAKILSNIK